MPLTMDDKQLTGNKKSPTRNRRGFLYFLRHAIYARLTDNTGRIPWLGRPMVQSEVEGQRDPKAPARNPNTTIFQG